MMLTYLDGEYIANKHEYFGWISFCRSFSTTNLSGPLPPELGNLTNLQQLLVSVTYLLFSLAINLGCSEHYKSVPCSYVTYYMFGRYVSSSGASGDFPSTITRLKYLRTL